MLAVRPGLGLGPEQVDALAFDLAYPWPPPLDDRSGASVASGLRQSGAPLDANMA